MTKSDKIDILLATFNGGRYLVSQLDSILAQTFSNWHLTVRDDCSTDNCPEIIRHYVAKHPEKFTLLDNQGVSLGSCANFARLLENATAEHIMFCDQDDVWLPHKIAVTFEKMREMEAVFGRETPILVYTDLKLVNENLQWIADSFWKYQRINPNNGAKLNRLVLQNVPNGCTLMINRRLCDKAFPIPAEAITHDWWLTLVAAAFGRTGYITKPTILYRQHCKNVSGARRWDLFAEVRDFCDPQTRTALLMRRNEMFVKLRTQAEAFLYRYERLLDKKNQTMLLDFLQLAEQGFFKRRYYTLKHGFWYGGKLSNIGLFFFR